MVLAATAMLGSSVKSKRKSPPSERIPVNTVAKSPDRRSWVVIAAPMPPDAPKMTALFPLIGRGRRPMPPSRGPVLPHGQ